MPEKTPQPAELCRHRLSDASVWTDPHPVFRAARETAPAGRTDSGHVIVFRRHLVDEVMRDTARFENILTSQFYAGEQTAIDEHWRYVMGGMMPPEHTRLRRFVSSAFTPRRVEQLRRFRRLGHRGDAGRTRSFRRIRADDGPLAEIPVRLVATFLAYPNRTVSGSPLSGCVSGGCSRRILPRTSRQSRHLRCDRDAVRLRTHTRPPRGGRARQLTCSPAWSRRGTARTGLANSSW